MFATGLLFAVLVPNNDLSLLAGSALLIVVLCLFAFLAWFSFQSARVMRYALRQHDVIVQSGVFWKQETVQPIRRIQHIEQHQGPNDKRFGLYELKLFSAGTGHFTFRIPGLDAGSARVLRPRAPAPVVTGATTLRTGRSPGPQRRFGLSRRAARPST